MRVVCLIVLAGCHRQPPPQTIENHTDPLHADILLTVSEQSFGPISAGAPASLPALRTLFPGFEVKRDQSSFMVYLGREPVAWVIPSDDGTVFNVHAKSPRVAIIGHSFRVGEPFREVGMLTDCECWGGNPTCYRKGDHVAVNFERGCDQLTDAGAKLRVLDGAMVQRVVWSPKPFVKEAGGE